MKRVFPFLLLLSALEIYCLVLGGKYLFDKKWINLSETTIVNDCVDGYGLHTVTFEFNNKTYRKHFDKYEYSLIRDKRNKLFYCEADSCLTLEILYIIFTICFGIFFILRTIDLFVSYDSDFSIGERFRKRTSILSDTRIDIYNHIDAFDTTPIKKKWYKFWGY